MPADHQGCEGLLRDLSGPDESARKIALLALGREREPRALPGIRRMAASDDSAELRFLAKKLLRYLADALGDEGAAAAGSTPAALDSPAPAGRIRALHVAAAAGAPEILPAVRARVAVETDEPVRASLATALGALGGRSEIALLETLSESSDPRTRANTIEALEAISDPAAYPIFVRFVSDPDNRIRANAIRALARLGRVNTAKLCLAMIRSKKAWMIESALYLLVPMKSHEAIPTYEELLGHASREIRARSRAGLARLAESGNGAAVRVLERAPPDQDASAGTTMEDVEALAQVAGSDDAAGLDASSVDLRLAALRRVEAAGEPDLPALIHRLEVEESARVRDVLVRLLGKYGDAGLVPILEGCLRDEDGRVRANAVEAIAHLVSDPAALKCLEPCLRDDNSRTKTNAVLALWGKLGNGPVQAMKELAASADKNTRLSAIYAIHQIGEPAASLLSPLMRDPDADVRQKAQECRKMLGLEDTEDPGVPAPTPRVTGKQPTARTTGKAPTQRATGKSPPHAQVPEPLPDIAAPEAAPRARKPLQILAMVVGVCVVLRLIVWLLP